MPVTARRELAPPISTYRASRLRNRSARRRIDRTWSEEEGMCCSFQRGWCRRLAAPRVPCPISRFDTPREILKIARHMRLSPCAPPKGFHSPCTSPPRRTHPLLGRRLPRLRRTLYGVSCPFGALLFCIARPCVDCCSLLGLSALGLRPSALFGLTLCPTPPLPHSVTV